MSLRDRVTAALGDSAAAERLERSAGRFFERRGDDEAAGRIEGPALTGLARVLATQPEMSAFLANRPEWLERVAELDADSLDRREQTLGDDGAALEGLDLESALDALRLRRREETALAACVDLGGLAPFESVSEFLSHVAETTTRFALDLARRNLPGPAVEERFAVIGMGKIAGREFTYHSDLDLIFLFRGGADEIDRASRIGQRLISYLTTMTVAGIAYAVDTRLRPSGQQGMLVASFDGYERYQTQQAATWEHLAMLRARPVAGALAEAGSLLGRVRDAVIPQESPPWPDLASLRERVVDERGSESGSSLAFKTGRGGLMDVDFLAGGGLLERNADFPEPPSVDRMLRAVVTGEAVEALLADYHSLRRIEAVARWVAGRGVETLPDDASATTIAELIESGSTAEALVARVQEIRTRIRAHFDRVVAAGSIAALEG